MSNKKQRPPIAFRPSEDLEDYLREKAQQGFRKLSQEIVMRLEASRQADQQPTTSKETK